jgi:hypothetical protein
MPAMKADERRQREPIDFDKAPAGEARAAAGRVEQVVEGHDLNLGLNLGLGLRRRRFRAALGFDLANGVDHGVEGQ